MIQINDDYYEDLTPESTVTLLRALRASAEAVGASEKLELPMWDVEVETGARRGAGVAAAVAKGLEMPGSGPMSGRKSCENSAGLTALTSEPWGSEMLRKDGQL